MVRVITLLAILSLVGCASAPEPKVAEKVTPVVVKKVKKPSPEWSVSSFKKHFEEWESVRYRWGGLSKKGVDCSGFVYLSFLEHGIKLPRTTALQVKLGETIPKNKLKTGDLVFFKTSRTVRHVGIYLKDNKFIHASSSKGVTTSSLKSKYWSRKYWTARRLDPKKLKKVS